MTQKLSILTKNIKFADLNGDAEICGIACDSRKVKPGFLFIALPGEHVNGNDFIAKALENGASAVAGRGLSLRDTAATIECQDPRAFMADIAKEFYGRPDEKLKVLGITGTDGKSSTVSFIDQLLSLSGRKSGFISTANYKPADLILPNPIGMTTPESLYVYEFLHEFVKNGKEYAIIESSSHGLSEKSKRLRGLQFAAGAVTNITHEHLEYHGSWEQYRDDKANLIRRTTEFSVLNADDDSIDFLAKESKAPSYTYSCDHPNADIHAKDIKYVGDGYQFTILFKNNEIETFLPLKGLFNVENLLAALLMVHYMTGEDMTKLCSLCGDLQPVIARMQHIQLGQNFDVIVDYAHTPGAFKKVLPGLRNEIKGRLILVFGSPGEKDVKKRRMQGEIADAFGDIIVVTDEDPRSEEPIEIIKQIAAGCVSKTEGKDLFLIPGREKAIDFAVNMAEEGDGVVLLGKGQERYISIGKTTYEWDEFEAATKALERKLKG